LDGPLLEPARAVEAAVEKDVAPSAADEPHRVYGVDRLVLRGAHDHLRGLVPQRVRQTDGLDGVVGGWRGGADDEKEGRDDRDCNGAPRGWFHDFNLRRTPSQREEHAVRHRGVGRELSMGETASYAL